VAATGIDQLRDGASKLASRAAAELEALRLIQRAGMLGAQRPDRTLTSLNALRRYGPIGGAVVTAAQRYGDRPGLVDELGTLSFNDLDRRSNALANAWRREGLRPGAGIGILARNHRGLLDTTFAAAKLGARALYLNTDFAGPQLRDVCKREGVELLVRDEEYEGIADGLELAHGQEVAWTESDPGSASLEQRIRDGDPSRPPAPGQSSTVILLTSGTTGTPKGAPRQTPHSLVPIGSLLSKVPYRSAEATYVAAPLFHGLGFGNAMLAFALGSTVVVRRRFDPEAVLAGFAAQRATALVVVPVMLQRILALPDEQRAAHDLSSLRIVFCGGAQLDAELARAARRELGDVVYNLYGSTEVAVATIATPADLSAAPGCAGRPPLGATVRILDETGREVANGETGRIFVGSGFEFEGYTGGGGKETIDGLMSSGDVGHFDSAGRLFVDGRDDEMIVSGGENVFPREIEELLVTHEAIAEAALIGIPDPEFGKRLRAFVAPTADGQIDADEVKRFVKENLARFKVPRDVLFLDALPRNPSGKVLKRELAEAEPASVESGGGDGDAA